MATSFQERRGQSRVEAAGDLFVVAGLGHDRQAQAQVLDFSINGMRLLFRPAVAIDPGMAIEIRDLDGDQADSASVQWCHHKRHFTVIGIRASAPRFQLRCTAALPA
ncbi:MAG: hypothetical protein RLZZ124_468 [Cyanobacteriota bacterium]|jgi:c-di-GMP-binding flagellar brake protein YcgR